MSKQELQVIRAGLAAIGVDISATDLLLVYAVTAIVQNKRDKVSMEDLRSIRKEIPELAREAYGSAVKVYSRKKTQEHFITYDEP